MKKTTKRQFAMAGAVAGAVLGIRAGRAAAATVTWTGAGATDNWTDNANWGGTPVAGNDVVFGELDVQAAQGTVNNIVDTNLTINSLRYENISSGSTFVANLGFHTTQIDAGRTLTINGTTVGTASLGPVALQVGREPESGPVARATVSFVGQGSLVVNSPTADIQIRQGSTNSGAHYALMDLSQLANFTANIDQLTIGYNPGFSAANTATGPNRTSGRLILGDVTTLTANNAVRSIVIGGTTSNSGDESQIELGRLTTFNAAEMNVGNQKANGRVYFRAGQTDAVFTLRGAAGGTSRMGILAIGDNSTSGNTSGALTGRMDLTGGAADFLVNTLYVGKSPTGGTATGTPMNQGFLTLEKGTINTNNLELGFQSFASGYGATGTLTLNGTGEITVNNDIRLGRTVGGAGSTAGILNLNSGTMRVFGNITTQGGTATVNLNGAMLDMQPGADTTPGNITATTLNFTSGTVRNAGVITAQNITLGSGLTVLGAPVYELQGGTLDASAGGMTVATGGALRGAGAVFGNTSFASGATLSPGSGTVAGTLAFSNDLTLTNANLKLKLGSDPTPGNGINDLVTVSGALSLSGTTAVVIDAIGSGPTTGTYRLIDYGTLAAGGAANLVPQARVRGTFTIDASTAGQFNLVVVAGAPQSLVWRGNPNNKWDVALDANWLNGATPDKFFQQDTVTFDDSSTNPSPVDLTESVAPAAVTFNATRNYTLVGAGGIAGGATLTKSGSGTLIIANTGPNTYTGQTTVSGGVLQIGNGGTVGSLGSGDVINDTMIVVNRSDAHTVNNVISGGGTVQHTGTGTLTLGGASSYSGGLDVNAGTVRLANAFAGGSGTIRVAAGATLIGGALAATTTHSNPLTLAGGTIGVGTNVTFSGDITALTGTTSTFRMTDPQNPTTGTTDVREVILNGTLGGNGNIVVLSNGTDPGADGGNGFRLRGTGPSTFSGSITVGNTVKFELQGSTTPGETFSPAGTGKIILTGGTYTGSLLGTYSQLLLRNQTTGDTTFGNNVEMSGTGFATLNLTDTASAPDGSVITLGNLRIGAGQTLGVNKNNPKVYTAAFTSVTLTGGNATFAPRTLGYGSTGSGSANFSLGTISEEVAGSGIVMDGLALTTLTGTNTYTGPTIANRGTLRITGSSNNSSGMTVAAGATLDFAAAQRAKSLTIAAGGSALVSAGVLRVGDNTTPAPLANAGLIDLKKNGLAVDTSPGNDAAALTAVRNQIIAGYNPATPGGDGNWLGASGITSTDAAAEAGNKGVGYALASQVFGPGGGSFMGTTVDGSAALARYTLLGDATLDGAVGFADLVQLAQNYNTNDGSRTWFTGDFTYDGNTNFSDLVKLAQNYNQALPTEPIPGASAQFQADLAAAFASVPEPGTLGLVGLSACGLAARRRRQSSR